MEKLENYENVNLAKVFFKSMAVALSLSLILIFILSILISSTNLKENIINPAVIFISTISLLIGAFLASKKIRKKGIILGALIGFAYMLLMYIISSLMNMDFTINLNSIIMIGFGVVGGAIGGILGVNLNN